MMGHSWLSHAQVTCQVAGVCLCCYPIDWINAGSAWLLLWCLLGAVTGIWALLHNRAGNVGVYPELKPNSELITTGPYQYVRHPMYSSLSLMMFGVAGYNGRLQNSLGLAMVILAVVSKAIREERFLKQRFPQYQMYLRKL